MGRAPSVSRVSERFFFSCPRLTLRLRLDALRESLTRLPGREVRVFVKDNEDLRREKYAAQQTAKAPAKKDDGAKVDSAAAPVASGKGKKEGSGNNNNNNNNNNKGTKKEEKKEDATIGHLDLRVGVVVSAAPHPDGDTLYVEQIDVGEAAPRTIVSGIREHVPLDQFVGARVLVMCNLKEKPLRGVNSNGMIVCASKQLDEKSKLVRLLSISADAKPGTPVVWRGEAERVQPDPAPVAAAKLGKLLKELRTDEHGQVVFGPSAFQAVVAGQVVTCLQVPNGNVG